MVLAQPGPWWTLALQGPWHGGKKGLLPHHTQALGFDRTCDVDGRLGWGGEGVLPGFAFDLGGGAGAGAGAGGGVDVEGAQGGGGGLDDRAEDAGAGLDDDARIPPRSSPVWVMVTVPPAMHMAWTLPAMVMSEDATAMLAMTWASGWTMIDSVVSREVPQWPRVISSGSRRRLPAQRGHEADSA